MAHDQRQPEATTIARAVVGEIATLACSACAMSSAEREARHINIASLPSLATWNTAGVRGAGQRLPPAPDHRARLLQRACIQRLLNYQADFAGVRCAVAPDLKYEEVLRDRFVLLSLRPLAASA